MPQKVRIALDAMGGDFGASVVVPGAAVALTRHPDSEFLLFGDSELIEAELAKHPALKAASRVIHTDVTVSMHDKPSQALRRGRKTSSMWLAIDAVKKGEADVAISAGNTGALMAMARFCLRMLPGIDRPAIAAVWPTMRGDSVVLDLGATIGGDAHHLVALAVMGSAHGERAVRPGAPDRRPAQYRGRGGQGRRGNPRGGRTAARDEPAATRIYRLRRGRRHRQGRRRRHRHRGFQRQHRPEGGRRHRAPDIGISAQRHGARPGAPRSAICSPAAPSRRCATRWTPPSPMAACCSV